MMFLTFAFSCVSTTPHGHEVIDHGAMVSAEGNGTGEEESSSERVEILANAEAIFSVPDGALLVYDETERFPFFVWTEPVSELGSLDPDLVYFYDIESGYVESTENGIGFGGDVSTDDAVADDSEVSIETTTLMFAYVGELPIESVSVEYTGVLPPPSGAPAPPPGWSSYEVGTTSQRRSVVWNYTSSSTTADFEHKHSSSASYHNLISNQSISSNGCSYAYDCVNTSSGKLRTRLYSSVDTDAFHIQFKTSCSASCY